MIASCFAVLASGILGELAAPAAAADLGSAQLLIAGTRLVVSPESQTVPLSTPTVVETQLEGYDPAGGPLPESLRVVAEFSGPEIDGVLTLSARPGEPLRIPRLTVRGEYVLDDIRLVEGEELLAYAQPRSAAVLVTQVLVTRVTSRPLTLDEARSYGIVFGDENFRAFNFTFGFAVDGEVFDYNLPVRYNVVGSGDPLIALGAAELITGGSTGTTAPRFRPPRMAPFTLQLDHFGSGPEPRGGCGSGGFTDDCRIFEEATLPGVILFPSEVSLLNQFFSVVLLAKNDAPEGDPLTIRDLAARVVLPPGLRMAETEPPTPLGVPVPVRVPGPDGELGTADDLTFLIAQAEGLAEVLVEGRQRGTHVVEFQLEGVLEGLAGGRVARVSGIARGAVIVRDPTLGMTITHPEVVRGDEEYTLLVTVTNTSNAPVNLVSVALPPGGLSGVQLLSASSQTVPTLLPGESEVVEFELRSLRTGRVVANSVKSGSRVDPSFELTMAIGDGGVPLSPEALILPRSAANLPPAIQRHALGLLGLGVSLAAAPESLSNSERPRLSREQVDEKAYWLAQAGRHVGLGEDEFDGVAQLAAEWTGARDGDWEWDALRRTTRRGGLLGDAFAQVFAAEAAATSPAAALDRFARTTAFLGPPMAALAEGSGARLEVGSLLSGHAVAGAGIDPLRRRELPFADVYALGGAEMALLARPEPGGYQARMSAGAGGADALTLIVPDPAGALRRVRFDGVALAAGGLAVADFRAADELFTLYADRDGDGVVDAEIPGDVAALSPRPFTALAAVQSVEADASGHVVDVLLSADLDLATLLPLDPARFTMPGKVSNGGLVPVEHNLALDMVVTHHNPFVGLYNTRVVRVIFDNPISPYVEHELTIRDLAAVSGQELVDVTLPVVTTATEPGTTVEGTVFGPDGQPVPFARVELGEVDGFLGLGCRRHKTAAVRADSAGRFGFDYVRQTACSDVFTLTAADPVSGQQGTARGRVRLVGGVQQLDVLMLGRGTLRGRVTYEDGSVPEQFRVVAYSPVFYEGREARVYSDGRYEVGDVPVGTVSLVATDRLGSFVFQTEELPVAGAVRERDLVIIRRPPDEATGDVRGTVYETDGVTPVFNAYLALYIDGELAGVERSGFDGRFDFGTVPTGRAEIEAFDGETGLTGAQVFFDVGADQVHDVAILLRDERGVVEGRVFRSESGGPVPVAGAVVWVSGTPFNTVSAADGSYRLDGVFAGARTLLAADLVHQVQTSAGVTVNGGGEVTYRDLIFPGAPGIAGGIAGEVLGFTGNPVVGAVVHIANGSGGWWREAFTNTLGRFELPDLPPGGYTLYAVSGQVGAVGQATIRFEGETPFVTIRFKKGTIRGVVRAEDGNGDPVGVQSLVTYRTTVVEEGGAVVLDFQPQTLSTEEDGSFEIPDVLAGRYTLHVSNPFHGERHVSGEIVFHGEIHDHEILFQENGAIRGTVFDWDGQTPVAGARVDLHHPSFGLYDLTTDEDGRFAFELVPPTGGRFPIDAEITAGTVYRRARVWVRFDRFGQELDVGIALPRQGTVAGFVEDANGNPVPGAVVTLTEHAFPGRRFVHNADGEGQFSFPNVFAGVVSLAAKAPALGGLGSKATVTVEVEGDTAFALLQLEPTGEIVGHVLSPVTGLPVPSVQVSLYRWGGGLFDSVTAGPDGAFRFIQLPLGQYRVWVFDPATGRHGEREGAWVEFNNHVREADVTLEVRGAVDGHLLDPGSGAGVPGATVRMQVSSLVPFTTYSSTDVEGYFEYLGIPEGTFALYTREPEGRRQASGAGSIGVEGERVTVDLLLEASGGVTGTVLNPPGAPAGPFANVNTLLVQDGQVIGATLDNPFTFGGVIAGRDFRLEAREVGGGHRGRATGRIASQGEVAAVDVTMRPIGEAEVTVRDSFGALRPGASVGLRSSGFYGGLFFASTGPEGTAVFQGVGEGHLDAWATDPVTQLQGSASGTLTLEGERVPLAVQLADAGTVGGRVLLSDGATPAEQALVVLTRGARVLQTFAAADGTFTFNAVPLGTFTVFAQQHFGPGTARTAGNLASNGQAIDVGTLVMDDYDPRVIELEPALYTTDLPVSTVVTIRFSEPLDAARWSGSWVEFRRLSGSTVAYTKSWADGNAALILTPNAPLASFTSYQVTVNDGYDLSGRRLTERARTVFTTADVVAPTVIDVLPRDGARQIPIGAEIKVTFSEPVVESSLSGAALQLTDLTAGQGVATTWQRLAGGREVILTPAGGLATDREYRLTVQGVEDGSGNVMTVPVSTTFWSVDTIPPEITSVTFPNGTQYTAGDGIPVAVEASDLWGVAEAAVRVAGWRFADASEPFAPVALAPVVAAPQTVTLTLEAVDFHGNVGTTTRTVDVDPLANATAPEVWAGCLTAGDAVLGGIPTALAVRAADDQAVESLAVFLDGAEYGAVTPVNLAEAEASLPWTPPAGAAPGTVYTVRLEARDFAGNVGVHEFQVSVPTGTVLLGGRSLFDDYAGQDVTLAGGVFLVRDPLTFGTVRVVGGATIVAPDEFPHLALTATGELRVQCGAAVRHGEEGSMRLDAPGTLVVGPGGWLDADGRGYEGASSSETNGHAPAWVAPSAPDGGGNHGGFGAITWGGTAGEVYDSVFEPTVAGGGGARRCSNCSGGIGEDGGGIVAIEAGVLRLEGEITARGAVGGEADSSGAGGAIRVRAGTLSGHGLLDASGGESTGCSVTGAEGSGGGGRVALYAASAPGFDPVGQLRAGGGAFPACGGNPGGWAGAGTVYALLPGMTDGLLRIANGEAGASVGRTGPATPLPALGGGPVTGFATAGGDAWVTVPGPLHPRWLGAPVVLAETAGGVLGTFRVAELDPPDRMLLAGAAAAAGAASYRGEYRFDRIELVAAGLAATDPLVAGSIALDDGGALAAGVQAPVLDIRGGTVALGGDLAVGELTLGAGTRVVPSADRGAIRIAAAGDLTIESGVVLDVDGVGYPSEERWGPGFQPPWVAPSTGDAGGSHGGAGQVGNGGTPGEVYDSVYEPRLPGATGAGDFTRPGGGVVVLEAGGTLTFDGEIRARGVTTPAYAWETGAGGSVTLRAGVLEGAGTIDASGGDSPDAGCIFGEYSGSGGGGRVAVHAGTANGFDPERVIVHGGWRKVCSGTPLYAGPGTLLYRLNGQVYGTLRIDSGQTSGGVNRDGPTVELPALGTGAVTAFEAAAADAWATADRVLHPRWLGAWMALLDAAGGELGAFRVAAIDASGRALLTGAAGATGAASFRGEYRFDAVELLHGAGVEASDPLIAPEQVFSGNVEVPPVVQAQSLRIAAGARVVPVTGGSLRFEVTGPMIVEPGAVIDVSGHGYPDGSAPSWAAPSQPDAGGSHGGEGDKGDGSDSGSPSGPAGEVFDSVYRPSLAGGDGADFTPGEAGQGGGVLVIRAGALTLDGTLKANADDSGAGGTVMLDVGGALTGTGTIQASGGKRDICGIISRRGMGGGGRIAIHAGSLDGFDPAAQAAAHSGELNNCTPNTFGYGGAGTVYWRTPQDTYGVLRIDNGVSATGANRGSLVTPLPALGAGAVTALEIAGDDAWVTTGAPLYPRWLGAWMALLDAAGAELGAYEVVELDGQERARLAGAAGAAAPAAYRGEYRFDRVDLEHGGGFTAADPVLATDLVLAASTTVPPVLAASSVLVESGATVRVAPGASGLVFDVTGSLVVEAGGVIDASSRGYPGGGGGPGGAPPSVTGSVPASGGSHGSRGLNGNFGGPSGEIFDSVFEPSLPGGGGADHGAPGAGGGVMIVRAGDVQLDGTLRANGSSGHGLPSSAGGTVALEIAGTLSGPGRIEAHGGIANSCGVGYDDGVGGAGRIAIRAGTLDGFDPVVQAQAWGGENQNCSGGGYRPAAAGTVFVHTAGMAHGELIVSNGTYPWGADRVPSTTELPTIGRGVVGVAEPDAADPADLWIEPADPAHLFSLGVVGMHVRVNGVDYQVLAEDAASRRRILLGGAAVAVAVGDGFVGVYRFDTVTVTNQSDLVLTDGLVAATLDIGSGSEITARDVEPPAIAITAPAAGTLYASGQTITVTADVTDNVAVGAVTFVLEDRDFTDDAAPWEWSVPAPVVAEERDAVIEIGAVDTDGNVSQATRTVVVQPLPAGDPPVVAIACPTAGALLAPATGLDLHVEASHDEGIERVELFLGADPSPQATDFDAPYVVRLTAPAGSSAGEVLTARVRATSFAGTTAEATLPVTVVEGAVLTADATLAAGDTSLDGGSVIVAGGTLTIEGPHAFEHLVVLDGAAVTHPPAAPGGAAQRLELSLAGDLFVACGGAIDAAGRGLPANPGDPVLAEDHFTTSASLADWQSYDPPGATEGPSTWSWITGGEVRQTKNISRSDHAGTRLLWNGALGTDDYRAGVRLYSGDDDKIGLVFRYRDADNYYRFRWHKQTPERLLERVQNGQATVLAGDAVPYVQSRWYEVEVEAVGSSLSVWIDGELVLTATDEAHATGTVGLYCDGNVNSRFDDFRVTAVPAAGEQDGAYAVDHFPSGASVADWQIVTRATTGGSGNWFWDNGMLRQTANSFTPNLSASGTWAVWKGELPPDYRARVRLHTGSPEIYSIGLLFRRRDDDNYYRFQWSKGDTIQTLDRVVNGQLTVLAQAPVAYANATWYTVEVEAAGPRLSVWIDGKLALTAWDETHRSGGVALYSRRNPASYFDDFRVGPPRRAAAEGGSHGGRGGSFAGGGRVYGSVFDPDDPGAGGGGPDAGAGGGVVRLAALGGMVIDGAVTAAGASAGSGRAGAGGSVRLDADSVSGAGTVSAAGAAGTGLHAAGSGGRIALYAATLDAGLLARTAAGGGDAPAPDRCGAAGTLYLKLDGQPLGELILDNRGVATDQFTELLALLPGTVGTADAGSITDPDAAFPDSVAGAEVYLDGDTGTLWPVLSNTGQTLLLDTSQASLTAQAGDAYAGLYRFDKVTVRGGARGIARNPVWSTVPAEVEPGSEWTPGYEPSFEISEPQDGDWFVAGEPLTVAADVSNLLGVRELAFSLAGSRSSVTTIAPHTGSLIVPPQAEVADHVLTVELTDLSGMTVADSVTVELRPSADPNPPAVAITTAQPPDGEVVLGGTPVDIDFTITDDHLIERYERRINGDLIGEVTTVAQASLSGIFEWTVPVSAPVGSIYVLRIQAWDYAGNTGWVEHTVRVPAGPLLTGNQTLDSAWDGSDLTLGAGTFTASTPLAPASLVLLNGATLKSVAGQPLALDIAGEFRLQTGSQLDVSSLGYAGGTVGSPAGGAPAWVSGSLSDAGGSHGGWGSWWNVAGTSGEVYDSVVRPRLSGGGGSRDEDGTGDGLPGGGVVEIVAGSVVLNGSVLANGGAADNASRPGGAGGTVRIEAGMLSGSGVIRADGGWIRSTYTDRNVGSGGGGRVALEAGSPSGFTFMGQVSASGALRYSGANWQVLGCAAPGTVFVRDGSMTYGELRIEHSTPCAGRVADTQLPELGMGSVVAWEVAGPDAWMTAGEVLRPRWDGAWMVLLDVGGSELGVFEVLAIDAGGRALLAGAGAVSGAASYRGEHRFDRVEVLGGSGLVVRDRTLAGTMEVAGAARLSGEIVATDLKVVSGAVVTPAEGGTLRLEAAGTLTIETGATVDVTGLGYSGGVSGAPEGGAPPWVSGPLSDAGGSHGGWGSWWDVAGTSGEVYDSVVRPRLAGGGGSQDEDGTGDGEPGGGVVEIVAGSVVLDGSVLANGRGVDNASRPGGAGGTVRIVADVLTGSGVIRADGGAIRSTYADRNVGSGGGGRVALEVGSLSGFASTAQVSASGAARHTSWNWTVVGCGAPGTVFVRDGSMTYGELRVAHSTTCALKPSPYTVLPTAGTGTVGATEIDATDAADLWIEPQDPNAYFDLGVEGMTVRIDSADYLVVDQSEDRRRLLLAGAAGIVEVGDAYQGIYKFDTVTVRNGAVLEFLDSAEVGTFDVDANSQVIQP